jgi:hypothetical protein
MNPNAEEEKNIDDLLAQRLAQIPNTLRELLLNSEFKKALYEISDTFPNLNDEKKRALRNSVSLTLLLFLPYTKLKQTIETNLEIPSSEADVISQGIESLIPKDCKEILLRFTFEDETDDLSQVHSIEVPIPAPVPAHESNDQLVQPLRTMEQDIHKIHGYGAREHTPAPETERNGPSLHEHLEEEIIQATSQDEVFAKQTQNSTGNKQNPDE